VEPVDPGERRGDGVHLVGSVGQLVGNKSRVAGQRGVGAMAVTKTGLTVAALAVTAWSRVLGHRVAEHPDVPVADATTPTFGTPTDVATAQRQLAVLQWAVPALTGALIVISSLAGEQQRPATVLTGVLRRLTG
jgi:CelD/BcsL family acetyltransferase involved in cellulose biosynthesis